MSRCQHNQKTAEVPTVREATQVKSHCKEKPQEAEVIALGTGKKDDDGNAVDFQVKVGDRILISKYGGTEVKFDEETYQLLREDDILGIVG